MNKILYFPIISNRPQLKDEAHFTLDEAFSEDMSKTSSLFESQNNMNDLIQKADQGTQAAESLGVGTYEEEVVMEEDVNNNDDGDDDDRQVKGDNEEGEMMAEGTGDFRGVDNDVQLQMHFVDRRGGDKMVDADNSKSEIRESENKHEGG